MTWYRIEAQNFIACVDVNEEGLIIDAAPILKRHIQTSLESLIQIAKVHNWKVTVIYTDNNDHKEE